MLFFTLPNRANTLAEVAQQQRDTALQAEAAAKQARAEAVAARDTLARNIYISGIRNATAMIDANQREQRASKDIALGDEQEGNGGFKLSLERTEAQPGEQIAAASSVQDYRVLPRELYIAQTRFQDAAGLDRDAAQTGLERLECWHFGHQATSCRAITSSIRARASSIRVAREG